MSFNDPAEEAAQRAARKDEKYGRQLRDLAVKDLLAGEGGRAYLWWLLQIGKWGVNPFTADRTRTDFVCGELNVGQQILNHILEVDPTGFIRMQQEQAERVANRPQSSAESAELGEPESDASAASAQPASG